jgi:hypothetical protein
MKLPSVCGQIECVVLSSLSESSVAGREKSFEDDRFVTWEGRTNDVTANGHVSVR